MTTTSFWLCRLDSPMPLCIHGVNESNIQGVIQHICHCVRRQHPSVFENGLRTQGTSLESPGDLVGK